MNAIIIAIILLIIICCLSSQISGTNLFANLTVLKPKDDQPQNFTNWNWITYYVTMGLAVLSTMIVIVLMFVGRESIIGDGKMKTS